MSNEAYIIKYYSGLKGQQNGPLSLSMVLGQNFFMFAVFAENTTRCVDLGHIQINTTSGKFDLTDKVSFLINNYLLHQKKFDKVQLSLLSGDFTMVPEAFAGNTELRPLLKFTSGSSETNTSRRHHLNDMSFLYLIDQSLLSYFESTFRNISIRHSGATTINLLLSHHSLSNTNVFLNVHEASIELAVKENNKLVFYNNFRCENNEDILYYLLFTMEQFNLDPTLIKLSLAGQIEASGDLANTIKRYVKQVSFCTHHSSLKLDGDLSNLPNHFYFTLLNQHLCEL